MNRRSFLGRTVFAGRALAVCAAAFLLGAGLAAQLTPDAPLRHFRIPMFGDDGFKTWELRGVEGIYLSAEESEIVGLDLLVFSGDERAIVENRIRSPRARVIMDEARAQGESSIFVSGPNFSLAGEDWTWEGEKRKITVRRSARVTFDEDFDILR